MESSCNKNSNYEEKGVGSLPDSILVCILSLLPLKVVVRTYVLCQRWRYLWTGFYRRRCRLTLCVKSNFPSTVADPRCFELACDQKVEEI
ncbi:hypothetical protein RDABS01_030172 [Bienertia sinuspersici]